MRQMLLVGLMSVLLLTVSPDAEAARRFGGGVSLGRPAPAMMQKAPASPSATGFQQSRPQAANTAQRPQPQAAQKPSFLRGALTGLAAALGIAALLSMLGINGSGMVSLVMGLLLGLVAFMLIRRFMAPKTQSTGPDFNHVPPASEPSPASTQPHSYQSMSQPESEPVMNTARRGSVMDELMGGTLNSQPAQNVEADELAGFDEKAFLKVALQNYETLQKAWASGQVLAISDFVSDEIFTAITHQMRDRKGEQYTIDSFNMTNTLQGLIRQGDEYLASVRFTGEMVLSGEKEAVDENWLLAKPVHGEQGWLLVGISPNT